MAAGKEIRSKIKSVENTKKITKAMEMVAASKMRKAQERMRAARPYSERIRIIAQHLSEANLSYRHPYLVPRSEKTNRVGLIVVSTDKGLCGGLNTNVLRLSLKQMKDWQNTQTEVQTVALGSKGLGFLNRLKSKVVAHAIHLGDTPNLDKLLGAAGVLIEAYDNGTIDELHICFTRFVNAIKQEPVMEQLLPLRTERLHSGKKEIAPDYLFEPDAKSVIDALLRRYVEALIYQSVAENMASEQSARMVAMKSATDNAGNVISELKLEYNKTRQAAITKELSEIVAGAAAV